VAFVEIIKNSHKAIIHEYRQLQAEATFPKALASLDWKRQQSELAPHKGRRLRGREILSNWRK